jgi:hypothetical protein
MTCRRNSLTEGTGNFLGQIRELIKVYRPDQGNGTLPRRLVADRYSARLIDPIDPS